MVDQPSEMMPLTAMEISQDLNEKISSAIMEVNRTINPTMKSVLNLFTGNHKSSIKSIIQELGEGIPANHGKVFNFFKSSGGGQYFIRYQSRNGSAIGRWQLAFMDNRKSVTRTLMGYTSTGEQGGVTVDPLFQFYLNKLRNCLEVEDYVTNHPPQGDNLLMRPWTSSYNEMRRLKNQAIKQVVGEDEYNKVLESKKSSKKRKKSASQPKPNKKPRVVLPITDTAVALDLANKLCEAIQMTPEDIIKIVPYFQSKKMTYVRQLNKAV